MSNPYPYTALPDLTGGACLEPAVDRTLFHPEGLGSKQQEKAALGVCARCPIGVRSRCLTDWLAYETRTGLCYGVAGGLAAEDRARLIGGRVGS